MPTWGRLLLSFSSSLKARRNFFISSGDILPPSTLSGFDYLRYNRLNKGMNFTMKERQFLGIAGLLPPAYRTQDEQLKIIRMNIDNFDKPLQKYVYLQSLRERNEKLFFRFVTENIDECLPIIYTPTVGLACLRYGLVFRNPRGIYITIYDRHHIKMILRNWLSRDVRAICVTDGERILGLGDLGAYGMGIPIGKLDLYTVLGRLEPHKCLPITLDVGTNNKTLLNDPSYLGLRRNRETGEEYLKFVDEFMDAAIDRFGRKTLVQFEDFAGDNASILLNRYRDTYCTFNDDIQGTGAAIVAALRVMMTRIRKKLIDNKILLCGAGSASAGITDCILYSLKSEGIPEKEVAKRIFIADKNGLLTKESIKKQQNKMSYIIKNHLLKFAKSYDELFEGNAKNKQTPQNLAELVKVIKPSVLIGVTGAGGLFTPGILKTMGEVNERPIILPLSNPTQHSECTPQAAYENTDGRCFFASGSPFKLEYKGRGLPLSQCNNAYIFPGVALGTIWAELLSVPNEVFLIAIRELVKYSIEKGDLAESQIFPSINRMPEISKQIAEAIVRQFNSDEVPARLEAKIERLWKGYSHSYKEYIPKSWEYPEFKNP